jgi:hypothetical protein
MVRYTVVYEVEGKLRLPAATSLLPLLSSGIKQYDHFIIQNTNSLIWVHCNLLLSEGTHSHGHQHCSAAIFKVLYVLFSFVVKQALLLHYYRRLIISWSKQYVG